MKLHKIKRANAVSMFSTLNFKSDIYGLQNIRHNVYKLEQINLIIRILKKCLKPYTKRNVFLIKKLPTFPVTKKPKEIRMGRGKGLISHKLAIFKKGQVIIELKGLNDILKFNILKVLKNKINCLKILNKVTW